MHFSDGNIKLPIIEWKKMSKIKSACLIHGNIELYVHKQELLLTFFIQKFSIIVKKNKKLKNYESRSLFLLAEKRDYNCFKITNKISKTLNSLFFFSTNQKNFLQERLIKSIQIKLISITPRIHPHNELIQRT